MQTTQTLIQKNGVDKTAKGKFQDPRKGKMFFTPKDKLKSKTQLKDLRKTIFTDRYSLKDVEGKPMEEHPEQMWERVSYGISQFEKTKALQDKWQKKFYKAMEDFKFVPAGRILSGAGTGYEVTFFNCYVIPSPGDSRGGIMESITQTVEIQARAGGVGLNLSTLRPRGTRVKKVNGTSSGSVSWASLYSSANHDVIQQGGSRRGALMIMLHDWHPDVEEFIKVKEDLTKIPGANLSVCVSDKFMKAVKEDKDWDLVFPDLDDPEYDETWTGDLDEWKKLGKKIITYKTVKASEIWDMIARAAWTSAEPGLHFLERSNKWSNTWYFEKLIATNPCGEQPLGAWSVCNLGALNLSAYVDENGKFNYDELAQNARTATRFLDNVVDANFYFYQENLDEQEKIRRTGLGTMGLGDTLIKMKIPYGSEESVSVIDKIYKTIRDNAYLESSSLAKEKGSFPAFDKTKYLQGHFIKKLPKNVKDSIAKNGIRNAVILTQAPCGTTGILAGASSGIEPVYDFQFKRTDRTGEHVVYHPLYKAWKKNNPGEAKPSYFVSAKDLSPEEHLAVQAKIQYYTDSSISKTVNAPNDYSIEDVRRLYTKAYELGCKGITFFRDGSRLGVLSSIDDDKKENGVVEIKEPMVERPDVVLGSTYKMSTPMGTAFITINEDDNGEPLEVFINIGKAGSDTTAIAESLGRIISATLRFQGNLTGTQKAEEIIRQLEGIGGRRSVGLGPQRIRSLPDAIAASFTKHFKLKNNSPNPPVESNGNSTVQPTIFDSAQAPKSNADICPECGSASLVLEEGCAKCYSCGHSEC